MITHQQKLMALKDSISTQKHLIASAEHIGLYDEVNERKKLISVLTEMYSDIQVQAAEKNKYSTDKKILCPELISMRLKAAELISSLSPDKFVKHGCMVFSNNDEIISMGINTPPVGFNHDAIDQTDKAGRKPFNEHAERAAIYNAAKHGKSLQDSQFYITGQPCPECLRAIIATGARAIVFGERRSNSSDEHAITNKKILAALSENHKFSVYSFNSADNSLIQIKRS